MVATGRHIVGYLANNSNTTATLAQDHPDFAAGKELYRLSGTSVSTAITSGIVALMLEQHPGLTPDEIKFQLKQTAQPVLNAEGYPLTPLVQGAGRVWAPDAVTMPNGWPASANQGMDIHTDLAHPWNPGDSTDPNENPDLAHHYQGFVQRAVNNGGNRYIYFAEYEENGEKQLIILGGAKVNDNSWVSMDKLSKYPKISWI